MDILGNFLKAIKKKHVGMMASGNWMLHWDHAPVHKARVATEYLAKRGVKMLPHPPYSPDLALADFFFFLKVKTLLGGP